VVFYIIAHTKLNKLPICIF